MQSKPERAGRFRGGGRTDHRVDWATSKVTAFELLDLLCAFHHGLKTTKGWGLIDGQGKRPFVPPEDPRHPQHAPPSAA